MNEPSRHFLAAIRDAATVMLGADHACTLALDHAARDGEPASAAAAQDALRCLDPTVMAELMGAAHASLRLEPAAILEQWRPPRSTRAN